MSRIMYPPVPFMTLDDLSESTLNSRTKFNDMFTIPYLEMVKVTTSEDDQTTVYPMIHAAWQSFNEMELRDTSQVRNVNIFALNMTNVLPVIPQTITVEQFIQVYGTVVDKYAELAKASEEQTKSFYTQFSQQIVVIEKAMTSMKEVISKLTTQIEQKNQEIQQENALNTLYTTLKRIFNLVSEKETVLDMMMMTFSDLNQTFQNMSQPLLQQLVLRLKQLRDAYVSAYSKSDALQRALTDTIQYSSSINGTWASLQSDFQKMKSNNALFPSDQATISYIINDWNTVKDVAQQYLQQKSSNGLSGQPNPPQANSDVMRMLMKNKSITNQLQTLLKSDTGVAEHSSLFAVSRSALPTNIQDMWDQISKDSGAIVSEINLYLKIPLVAQISVQTESGGATDLRTRFQDLLNTQQTFQVQSVPVLRQLYSFADKNDTIDSNYISTYTQQVRTLSDSTQALFQQYTAFRNSFQNLQAQIQKDLAPHLIEDIHYAVLSYLNSRMDALLQNSIYVVSFALNNICQDTEANLTWMKAMASLSPIPDTIVQSYNNNWKNCMNSIYSYIRVVSNTGSC